MASNIDINHFKNLVAVAFSDGELEGPEMSFLRKRAEEIGLANHIVQELFDNADQLQFIPPESEEEKEELLGDVVYVAMVDGEIEPPEYQLCLNVAKKLDMDQEDLDLLIRLANKLADS